MTVVNGQTALPARKIARCGEGARRAKRERESEGCKITSAVFVSSLSLSSECRQDSASGASATLRLASISSRAAGNT